MKITRLFLLMLILTVSAMAAQPGGGRLGAAEGGEDSLGGSNSTTCEWYWIRCSNMYQDECCGNLSTCWTYCEQVCNEPCQYTPHLQA